MTYIAIAALFLMICGLASQSVYHKRRCDQLAEELARMQRTYAAVVESVGILSARELARARGDLTASWQAELYANN